MAGSRKGKGKKSNQKSSHSMIDTTRYQQEIMNVNHDSKDDCLEKILLKKVELQYEKALEKLIALNYSKDIAYKAMMINGCIYGPSTAIIDNIVRNSISFIETGQVIDERLCSKGEPIFKDMKELVTCSMQALINVVRKDQPKFQAVKDLLLDKSVFQEEFSGECSNSEVVENETERLIKESSDALRKMKINSPPSNDQLQGVLSSTSKKVAVAVAASTPDKIIDDLVDNVNKLMEDLKERKQWATETMMQAAKRLSHDLMELHKLRSENQQTEGLLKKENEEFSFSCTEVANREERLRWINCEIARVSQITMNLINTNLDIKATIAAYQLCDSENHTKLRLLRKKQKQSLKILSDTEKHVSELKTQIEQEKHGIAQIEENMLQAAEAEKQAKLRQMQEAEAKKQARLHFLEADRLNRKAKEEFELQVVTVRHELDANKQRLMNEISSRKNLLSLLKQTNVATPSSSSDDVMSMSMSMRRNIKHLCLICHTNKVNVVFLPCKHEVTCEHCNLNNAFDSFKGGCPCCNVRIHKRIKVYGPSV